ncbi:carbohydrate ABC transporter permease [Ferrimicrobium acidiphilum]|nr:carbohydrate ABC transporter permease [Ferrimicrobium acidiphilum]
MMQNTRRRSRRIRRHISRWFYLAILTMGALVMFIPFAWSLSTSLKPLSESLVYPPVWIPHIFDWENYVKIWHLVPLARWFGNSAIAAIGVTIGNLICDSMAGYALARVQFRGQRLMFIGVLAMLMVPFQSVMLPVYILLRAFGLLDNYYGLIIPLAVQAVGIFLMRQAFLNLPSDLEDAAIMDGAGRFRMFWQLSLPLVLPSLLTLALISFMLSWNNFLLPLLVASRPHLWTVPLGVVMFQQEYFVNWPYLMAAAVMTTIPVAVIFLVFQKWFVRGIATTGMR